MFLFFMKQMSEMHKKIQACNLRDHYQTFQAKGYEILGVSADSSGDLIP